MENYNSIDDGLMGANAGDGANIDGENGDKTNGEDGKKAGGRLLSHYEISVFCRQTTMLLKAGIAPAYGI